MQSFQRDFALLQKLTVSSEWAMHRITANTPRVTVINGQFYTDIIFKLYSVKPTDNYINNNDWLNWGMMVPFGAPFIDVNNNGTYEFMVDTPGVKGASQTVFVCITDADSANHTNSEGFSGGTKPIGAEIHLTAWGYNSTGLQDIQFFKWVIINKHVYQWD